MSIRRAMPRHRTVSPPERPDQTIWQAFQAERPSLVGYPGRFDGFHAMPAAVAKTCLVPFGNNKYSVLAKAVGRPAEVQAYADQILIRAAAVRAPVDRRVTPCSLLLLPLLLGLSPPEPWHA